MVFPSSPRTSDNLALIRCSSGMVWPDVSSASAILASAWGSRSQKNVQLPTTAMTAAGSSGSFTAFGVSQAAGEITQTVNMRIGKKRCVTAFRNLIRVEKETASGRLLDRRGTMTQERKPETHDRGPLDLPFCFSPSCFPHVVFPDSGCWNRLYMRTLRCSRVFFFLSFTRAGFFTSFQFVRQISYPPLAFSTAKKMSNHPSTLLPRSLPQDLLVRDFVSSRVRWG